MTRAAIERALETNFNVFRHKTAQDLCCAVPESQPVPGFLDGSVWAYATTFRGDAALPPTFDRSAAHLGARLNSYHLFHMPEDSLISLSSRTRPNAIDQDQGRAEAIMLQAPVLHPQKDWVGTAGTQIVECSTTAGLWARCQEERSGQARFAISRQASAGQR